MCVYSVFLQLINSISSDLYTLFDYFNLALSHSLDIFLPSVTFINRTYSKFSCFNIEFDNLRQLLRRLQRKYASSKLESLDHFTIKNVSLQNRHTSQIC